MLKRKVHTITIGAQNSDRYDLDLDVTYFFFEPLFGNKPDVEIVEVKSGGVKMPLNKYILADIAKEILDWEMLTHRRAANDEWEKARATKQIDELLLESIR